MAGSTPPAAALRVLHCIPDMAGGGAERQLTLLAEAQTRSGIDAHVALTRGGPNLTRLEASGAVVHHIRTRGNHDPRLLWRLHRLVRTVAPAIIQTWLTQMDVMGGLVATMHGLPWVLSERASATAYQDRLKERVVRRVVGARADAVAANSETGLSYWRDKVRAGAQLAVVPNCLSLGEIDTAPPADLREFGLEPGRPVALFAGRLVAQKNLPLLLSILSRVLPLEDAVALLCGDGPDRSWLETSIRDQGLSERVRVLGYRSDLLGLMKRAQVFVNPSTFEGQPNTVLEAMACGCPVVVSAIAEHRELLDESCAAIVPLDALDQWVAAVQSGLRGSDGSRTRANRARQLARGHSPEATARGYRAIYEQLLTRRRTPGPADAEALHTLFSSAGSR